MKSNYLVTAFIFISLMFLFKSCSEDSSTSNPPKTDTVKPCSVFHTGTITVKNGTTQLITVSFNIVGVHYNTDVNISSGQTKSITLAVGNYLFGISYDGDQRSGFTYQVTECMERNWDY